MMCSKFDLQGLSEYILYNDSPILNWPQPPPVFWGNKGEIEDYITTTANGWELFSARTVEIFHGFGVRGVDFHPVRIIVQETGEEIEGYAVAHVWNLIEGLDREHSDWMAAKNNPDKVISVFTAVLRAEAVQNEDAFRLKESKVAVYLSERVTKAIKSQKLTGFKFFPIKAM